MAQIQYNNDQSPITLTGKKVALLCPQWHKDLVMCMANKCQSILQDSGVHVDIHHIPGSMEIPYCAQALAKMGKYDALVGFGIIVKGQTWHFDMIMNHITHGVTEMILKYDIPFINEVLPVDDLSIAIARASDDSYNKGIEAAQATLAILQWRNSLETDTL